MPIIAAPSIESPSTITPPDTAAFAWEILRRNPHYRASIAVRAAERARDDAGVTILFADPFVAPWGLQFRRGSEDTCTPSGLVLASTA